jgi:tetratricopeptide (TPR) repeat protein
LWLPELYKVVGWRIGRLQGKRATFERRVTVAAGYVRLRPGDPHGWIIWGNMLVRHGDYEEAERVLRRAMSRHARADAAIGWLLARSLTNQSKLGEARELLEEQAGVFPSSRLPLIGLAEVALRERRWDEAKMRIEDALQRTAPTDVGGTYEAARLLAPIPGERARAIRLIRDAIEDGLPPNALPHLTLGVLLELEGDADAQEHLREAESLWDGPGDFAEELRRTRNVLTDPGEVGDGVE